MEDFFGKPKFEISQSPMKEAYELLEANSPLELSNLYTKEDQKILKGGSWDYNNPDLIIHKIKDILEAIDEDNLAEEEKVWRNEILWFWYHHAISCAIFRYKDRIAAKEYSTKALSYKDKNHPNKITDIFDFLIDNRVSDAEQLAEAMDEDKETALELIEEYKEGNMF